MSKTPATQHCILDGAELADAAAVYRAIAAGFAFPAYFGGNLDALWDALSEPGLHRRELSWRNSAISARRLGAQFDAIVTVLKRAVAAGMLTLRLL